MIKNLITTRNIIVLLFCPYVMALTWATSSFLDTQPLDNVTTTYQSSESGLDKLKSFQTYHYNSKTSSYISLASIAVSEYVLLEASLFVIINLGLIASVTNTNIFNPKTLFVARLLRVAMSLLAVNILMYGSDLATRFRTFLAKNIIMRETFKKEKEQLDHMRRRQVYFEVGSFAFIVLALFTGSTVIKFIKSSLLHSLTNVSFDGLEGTTEEVPTIDYI